jgi:hypothetical protein
MQLSPEETTRFYRVWVPLLHYVNEQRRLVAPFPVKAGASALQAPNALRLRDALWADEALRVQFLADNPAQLRPEDLALVASWQFRVAGNFFIVRYIKQYTVFFSETTPTRAYGVLGLASPIEELAGPALPVYVQAVLLPFEGRIIYDSLLGPYAITFGPGIRQSLKQTYRDALERESIITSLPPTAPASPEAVRDAIQRRNRTLLAAFRRELVRAGLSPRTTDRHLETVTAFAEEYLLREAPPRGLVEFTAADLQAYVPVAGRRAERTSFQRFVRFLMATGRRDYDVAAALRDDLKQW